jgi:LuxR family transcriptional regulator, maltose regulon positive regulatory protein
MPTRQAEPPGAAHATPAAPVIERRRIVASKLAAPPLRPGIVDRPEPLRALTSAAHAPVVLVSAPAGYGKTTLLALWRQRDERPFAWVTLEARDNDPVALLAAVLASLDPILGLDPSIGEGLNVPQPSLEDVVAPSLVDACVRSGRPFVLVLDDLHLVSDRRCHTVIGYLAEWLPPECQLALGTRTDPPLPLGSWRAHGRLAELRATDLALGDGEARALFAAAGVPLTDGQVTRLVERTEGWPAALYLAALSLRGRSDPADFVERFAGTSRHVAEFLSEDVLARQPDDVMRFLLRTCVLDELTASLCAALTDAVDAEAMLRELERGNLFVVPLDEERHAYRYHHLFVQYLRAELARRDPQVAPELHRRAWRWYRRHGLTGRAVAHAQAAGDVDVAAELVATRWGPMCEAGHVGTVRDWLAGFQDAQIEGRAPLAIAAARVAAATGERERAARFADAARRGSWDGPMPDGTASLESALAIMSAAFGLGGLSGMRAAARRAVELEPPTSDWRGLALMLLGVSQALGGDLTTARVALEESVRLKDGTSTGAVSLAYLALVSQQEGDEDEALRHARRAHAVVERPGLRAYMPSICAYTVIAHLLARRGDVDEAAPPVERAEALLPHLTDAYWWQMIVTRVLLAPALWALGRRAPAAAHLDEAEALLAAHPDAGALPAWHATAARTLGLTRDPASRELSDAERRIVRLLASDLSLREIGRELYLSMNTVKTHTRSIYRKLGVSSRREAVEAARNDPPGPDSPG